MAQNNSQNAGVSFCGLLAIVFITLRLCKVITWSWWWVLAPLWIPFALVILVALGQLVKYVWKRRAPKK